MNRKKLFLCIELLKNFSQNQLKDLEKILSCEYFNTDNRMTKLLDTFRKYKLHTGRFDKNLERIVYPLFDDRMQCAVYSEVFEHLPSPKERLSKNERSWLNQNINKLMRLVELFLSIENLKKNEEQKNDLLYTELLEHEQYRLFNQRIKKDKMTLEKQFDKGLKYYAQKYKIEKAIFAYLHKSDKLAEEDNLPDLITNLDMYYILDKLELWKEVLSMKYGSGKREYDLSSMEAITLLLDLPQYVNTPLIILYRANITLIKEESEEAYIKFLGLLNQYELTVPNDTLSGFYTSAVNYCVGQIKQKKLQYIKKMFELYKIMDKKQLLVVGGVIPAVKLKNIVTISCRVEEYEWAKGIIERYRPYIARDIRNDVYHLNLGNIALHQKDYETAHTEFMQVNKVSKIYNINERVATLKCRYETDNNALQAFRSAKKFFKESKSLPTKDKKGYSNFIEILILLYHVRHNVNATKTDFDNIKEKLLLQEFNSDESWLLEKIEELEHKIK